MKDHHVRKIFIASFAFFLAAVLFAFVFQAYQERRATKQIVARAALLEKIKEERLLEEQKEAELEKKKVLQTSTILASTIESHIPEEGKFIAADLDKMKLYLYEDAEFVEEYPILSKGKPGSFWETPSGNYKILDKLSRHFSSVGEVYMPWSMQFYGNFFIHGWPYYPDGTPVPPGYSGGCIRLGTEDAKAVFEFAQKGTPIYVHESTLAATSTAKALSLKNVPAPEVSAKAYIVADVNTGEVFLEKNKTDIYPIASLTKLMTAIVANEAIMFDRKITITDEALESYGDSGNLRKDEVITAHDLLYPLLMESSNDAAKALALYYGENGFVSLMNKKAEAIGMKNTHFSDSSGIDDNNTSNVHDLYLLAQYVKNKKSFILNITKLEEKNLTSSLYPHTFRNFNIFSKEKEFLGGKTGHTKAAEDTMITLFEIPVDGEKRNVAFIVLQSLNRERDIRALLDWFKQTAA
jgi:hypothetical protein